ncbi:tripartite tricarboxylate transporter TctB family protein [Aneurinibacillus sp. REN35]|uniref:tripartite tricarboxylate transporter TctB family protein n=1 Tax=Aneurinibacillus sp. REN35 TaxID=3237286 RepID=UPI00352881F0
MSKTFDRTAGLLFLLMGLLFALESRKIAVSAYGSTVGSNIFPLVLGIVLILLSLRLLYETFYYTKADDSSAKLDYKRFLIIFVTAGLYCYFLEEIGYVIGTFIFLLIGFQTMERTKLILSIVISTLFSFGVYYLFVHVLQGSLPGFPEWMGF